MALKSPEFSTVQAEEDTVLYCLKKRGQSVLFKYVSLGSCRIEPGGKSLEALLKEKDDEIQSLQKQINAINIKLGLTSELAVLTAESREE